MQPALTNRRLLAQLAELGQHEFWESVPVPGFALHLVEAFALLIPLPRSPRGTLAPRRAEASSLSDRRGRASMARCATITQ
jgi:hypothetical protein